MSDDSIIRDERGRIVKGSPGLHQMPVTTPYLDGLLGGSASRSEWLRQAVT
jgi:hypothetical protein